MMRRAIRQLALPLSLSKGQGERLRIQPPLVRSLSRHEQVRGPMLIRETAFVRMFALKVPVLLFLGPHVVELDEEGCAVRIPLGWRSKNHVGSMYFGALCAGADLAAGLSAFRAIREGHRRVVPIFKDLRADFLKRADGDVVFRSREGRRVAEAVRQADETGERITLPVEVVATVPKNYADEPVARFTLGLSLRRKDTSSAARAA
jgi:acyl-coenzyme A thioesterase PaaI-like protein